MKNTWMHILKIITILISIIVSYVIISILLSFMGRSDNSILGEKYGSHFEEIDGKNIAYRFIGSKKGSGNILGNVILVHGFAAWGKTWIDQEDLFSKYGYNVYSLDLPPFGFSDDFGADFLSREKQAELINKFILKKSLDHILLMTHSYGGKSAMEAYMQSPGSYSGLILLDVALGFPRDSSDTFTPPTGTVGYFAHTQWFRDMSMRFLMFNTFLGTHALRSFLYDPSSLSDERLAIYQEPFRVRDAGKKLGDWLAYILTHAESGKSTEADNYTHINIPTLIIWGKEDTITPIKQGRELHKMIPSSTLHELDRVNHIPQIENPAQTNEIILQFLRQNFQLKP